MGAAASVIPTVECALCGLLVTYVRLECGCKCILCARCGIATQIDLCGDGREGDMRDWLINNATASQQARHSPN